jgi:serine phosphatase RsbU (regulator of sigma subunit)
LADAVYEGDHVHLKPGDRFILVTDGVTEAENAEGEFFDNERLEAVAAKTPTLEDIFSAVNEFCCGNPLGDDCTVVELLYTG